MKPEMSTAVMIERVREMAADSADSQDHVLLTQVANRIELLLAAESGMSREMACIRHALDIPPDQSVQSGVVNAFVRLNGETLGLRSRLEAYDRAAKEPVVVNDDMALAFFRALTDETASSDDVDECKIGLRAAFANISPPLPVVLQTLLRELVDVVWQEAKESTEVPSTEWADELIGKVFPAAQTLSVVPDNSVTAEHQRVIGMLLGVCGAAFELADDTCQQEVDGEACHVVPHDAFQKLSDALDEIENTLPNFYPDLPNTVLTWAAVPRRALKSLLQSGNPVWSGIDWAKGCEPTKSVPEGWALVPIDATRKMIDAAIAVDEDGYNAMHKAMIAAAPKLERKDGDA